MLKRVRALMASAKAVAVRRGRSAAASLVELVGLGLTVYAADRVSPTLASLVAGVELVAWSMLLRVRR